MKRRKASTHLCFSCDRRRAKYVDGLCVVCNKIATRVSTEMESHWERQAHELVVRCLFDDMERYARSRTRSVVHEIAHQRLKQLVMAEDAALVEQLYLDKTRWQAGAALALESMGGPKIEKRSRRKIREMAR